MLQGFFINFCILVTLTFLMAYLLHVRLAPGDELRRRLINFAAMTMCGLVLMQFPVRLTPGVFFDLRSVIPAVAGLGGGIAGGLPVALALAAYRFWLGGAGVTSGVLCILIAGLLGGLLSLGSDALTVYLPRLLWRVVLIFIATNLPIMLATEIGQFRQVYPLMVFFNSAGLLVCLSVFRSHYHADRDLREYNRMAHTDALTGLQNMRSFEETVKESLQAGAPSYLLLIDLDRFKLVNDNFGHEYGNVVLSTIAGLIRSHIRAADIPFRYGGEEFAVLLRNCYPEQAVLISERLRSAVAEHPFKLPDGGPLQVTLSGGLIALRTGIPVGRQVALADRLLYQAKAAGRNRIESSLGHKTETR